MWTSINHACHKTATQELNHHHRRKPERSRSFRFPSSFLLFKIPNQILSLEIFPIRYQWSRFAWHNFYLFGNEFFRFISIFITFMQRQQILKLIEMLILWRILPSNIQSGLMYLMRKQFVELFAHFHDFELVRTLHTLWLTLNWICELSNIHVIRVFNDWNEEGAVEIYVFHLVSWKSQNYSIDKEWRKKSKNSWSDVGKQKPIPSFSMPLMWADRIQLMWWAGISHLFPYNESINLARDHWDWLNTLKFIV